MTAADRTRTWTDARAAELRAEYIETRRLLGLQQGEYLHQCDAHMVGRRSVGDIARDEGVSFATVWNAVTGRTYQRTIEELRQRKRGRPYRTVAEHVRVLKLLRAGVGVCRVALMTGVSRATVSRINQGRWPQHLRDALGIPATCKMEGRIVPPSTAGRQNGMGRAV